MKRYFILLCLLMLCGCMQSESKETLRCVSSGDNQIVPYEITEPSVRDGAYATQQQRGTILYTEPGGSVTLQFEKRQRNVAVEVWPAWDWQIFNHDPWQRWELSADKSGCLTLPMEINEAYLIRVTAAERTWLFAVDPMPEKPEIPPMVEPPELTVQVGEQTVTAQRGTYSWNRPGSSRDWDESPMFERDAEKFQNSALMTAGECFVECKTEVAPEKVTAALYVCGEREPVWIKEVEMAEDGSFSLDLSVDQAMILDLWVEMPVNHWIGRAWGGTVDYGVLLMPEG